MDNTSPHRLDGPPAPPPTVVDEKIQGPEAKPKPEAEAAGKEAEHKKPWSPLKLGLAIAGAAIVVLGATAYWYRGTFYEDTDDAQIDGYTSNVASRVGGTVVAVHVEDNQHVESGRPLVELDPTDLRVARDQARAAVAQAEAQLRAEQSTTSVTETSSETLVSTSSSEVASGQAGVAEARRAVAQATEQIKQAEADDQLVQLEQHRSETLLQSGAIARAEYDRSLASATASSAHLQALREGVEATRRRVDEQLAKAA